MAITDRPKGLPRAVVFGCAGPTLSDGEKRFFADRNPLGFILFGRNVASPDQVRALVAELRETVGDETAPVLIDQEGGRVQRLGPPHWRAAPAAGVFAAMAGAGADAGAGANAAGAAEALRLNAALIAADLADLGITVDCWPVLDLPRPDADPIIGDRALGTEPRDVAGLGGIIVQALEEGGVTPVVKHIPGHGRATVDSHQSLPIVETSLKELSETDFQPFRLLAHAPWAMTAHVVYTAVDDRRPATFSAKVIDQVVRGDIGFDGLLISDDLGMGALKGDYGRRTTAALDAGCDLVLHCNGEMAEMTAIGDAAPAMTDVALARFARGEARRTAAPAALDRTPALARLADLLAATDAAEARA